MTPSVTETSVFLLKLLRMAPYIETPSLLIYLISIKKSHWLMLSCYHGNIRLLL